VPRGATAAHARRNPDAMLQLRRLCVIRDDILHSEMAAIAKPKMTSIQSKAAQVKSRTTNGEPISQRPIRKFIQMSIFTFSWLS
jgi:hypothetical protein